MKRLSAGVIATVLVTATTLATVTTPAAASPGWLEVVHATAIDLPQQGFTGANPMCPQNSELLGAGADIIGGGHSIRVIGIKPDTEAAGDFVWATAGGDTSRLRTPFSIDVTAICGQAAGWEIVEASSPSPTPGITYASATANCPAGKKVSGAGGRSWKPSRIVDSIDISADLSSVTVEVIEDAANPPQSAVAQAYAYAICITPKPGQHRVSAWSALNSTDKHVSVQCPPGARVIGTGGGLVGAAGSAYIDRLAPIAVDGSNLQTGLGFGGADIEARETVAGTTQDWRAYVYAVCVDFV